MLNLIKMDLYRLFKTKSFKVGLFISAAISAIVILAIAGIGFLNSATADDPTNSLAIFGSILTWGEGVSLFEILFTGLTKMSLVVTCVLSAIYVSEEQISGFVKNVAGQTRNKGMMILSKFVAIAVLTLFVFIAYCLGAGIVGYIFFHKNMTMDMMGSFIAAFVVRYLLYVAVGTIVLFLCTLTKNKSLAIAIGVIFGTGITNIAYTMVELVLALILKVDLRISSIMPDGLASQIDLGSSAATLMEGTFGAVFYIVIFLLISTVIMVKRDTR